MSADSISAVESLWPETLMTSSTLPRIQSACERVSATPSSASTRSVLTVSVVVASRSVAREVVSGVREHVGLEEPLVVAVDGTRDARPGLLDGQDSLRVVALDNSTGGRVEQDGLDSEERQRRGSRLRLGRSGERAAKERVSFRARASGCWQGRT